MSKLSLAVITILLGCFMSDVSAYAWEVTYDAASGLLPSSASPAWIKQVGNGVYPTVTKGVLHINDNSSTDYAYYLIEPWAILAGVPVTMEARMRVAASSDPLDRSWVTVMGIQTRGAYIRLSIYPDHLCTYDYSVGALTYNADFTTFRTIRIGLDANNQVKTWVDGQLALSFSTGSAGQSGIFFGAGSPEGTSDSYWQYVSYSKQYLPVPEHSSLLALAAGFGTIGGCALRRRKI